MSETPVSTKWPMKTSGLNPNGSSPKRGACVECQDAKTVDEVLYSFDGGKGAVCGDCASTPKYKRLLGN